MELFLTRPTNELKEEYLSFYQEWKESGEKLVPWSINIDPANFQEMIQFLFDSEEGKYLPANRVPSTTFWLVNVYKRVIGAVNIRHHLTDDLLNRGGHIGYGIRPAERRKGYATKLLSLSLEKAKELGIQKVLVVCDKGNIGSEKTILNNGGLPDTDYIEGNGNIIKRYWIDL